MMKKIILAILASLLLCLSMVTAYSEITEDFSDCSEWYDVTGSCGACSEGAYFSACDESTYVGGTNSQYIDYDEFPISYSYDYYNGDDDGANLVIVETNGTFTFEYFFMSVQASQDRIYFLEGSGEAGLTCDYTPDFVIGQTYGLEFIMLSNWTMDAYVNDAYLCSYSFNNASANRIVQTHYLTLASNSQNDSIDNLLITFGEEEPLVPELIANTTWWYNETGGLNASWTKWDLDGGTALNNTDNFEASSTSNTLYGVNASLPHDKIITFNAIFITDDNPGRNSHFYILNSSPDNDVGDNYKYMIWVDGRDTWGITENGVTLANGAYDFNKGDEGEYAVKIILYPNKTIELWIEGGFIASPTANSAMTDRDDIVGIYSYTSSDTFENSWDDVAWSWIPDSTLSIETDLTNTINYNEKNITIDYWGNFTITTDYIYNCSLYVDSQLNQSDLDVDISQSQTFFVEWEDVEKDFTFEVQCENAELSDTTGIYTYSVDTIDPRITLDMVNGTIYTKVLNPEITINSTYYDPNLFAYNRTVYNSTGSVIYNEFAQNFNDTNTTTIINQTVLDADTMDVDSFVARHQLWDSHTNNKVKELQWFFQDNNLIADGEIIFEGDLKELDAQDNPATYFYLAPEGDKYKLKVTWNEDSLTHVLNLTASGNLVFLPGSEYPGHFVYMPTERWIDFWGTNINSVDVEEVLPNKYQITIYHDTPTDEIEFESLGSLNTRIRETTFSIEACPESWQPAYTICTIGDNHTLYYTDTNACGTYDNLPGDNGTISSCNYCSPIWQETSPECVTGDSLREITYDYTNSCCEDTGLPTDCNIPANTTESCIGIHSSVDIGAVSIDFAVEIGIALVALASILVIGGVYIFLKKRL